MNKIQLKEIKEAEQNWQIQFAKLRNKLTELLRKDMQLRRKIANPSTRAEELALIEFNVMRKDVTIFREYINYARKEMDYEEVVKLENHLRRLSKEIKLRETKEERNMYKGYFR